MPLVGREFASTAPATCRIGALSVTRSSKLVSVRLNAVVCEFAMLPEMFCRAKDCACNPVTAVVRASKIPIPSLHSVAGGSVRTAGRGTRRKHCARTKATYNQWLDLRYRHPRPAGCATSGKTCRAAACLAERADAPYGPPRRTSRAEKIMRFEGTSGYVATEDLKVAVNAAITLERPLLVKGEPGTGKTVLALEIAKALNAQLIEWHVKSTTKALQGLYEYDAVSRLRDSQLGDERVKDIRNYIKRGKLWDAFVSDERPVLLIDEVDKADIEFPNDLLLELDRMEFFVYQTSETIKARRRPIVMITSNNEKELPDAFLRRCFFHFIKFPERETMQKIIDVHYPGIKQKLVSEALKLFYEIREVPGMKKKPSTSELLDWLKLLLVEDIGPETLRERDPKKLIPPLHGALIKNEQDVHLFERLAFLARREGR